MKKLLTLLLAFMATTATLFADSGTCGANVNWDLTGGVLTISGTGYMTSYTSPSSRPWHSFASSITSVVIEEGVMSIGESAFEDFSSLTSVTIPNSLEVIEGYAFFGCSALSSVTIPDNIMAIGNSTFKYCSALTTITIPANVNYIKYQAFSGCTGLTEIICEATTPPTCEDLVFEEVTNTIPVYVPAGSVAAYKAASGWNYFENIQAKSKEIYAALSGSTMTIYFDDQKASRPGVLDKWTPGMGVDMDDATRNSITRAVISPSMVDALPTGTKWWFFNLANLTTIEGLAYLNTSEVENMQAMFMRCSSLTSLDLSSFNTDNVTNMTNMFSGCSALTSLDVSGFNTDNVTNMTNMFSGCSSLSSLDLSSFNTAKVTDMSYMFRGCESLKTIYCNDAWNPSSSGYMFYGCTALVGGEGTKYDDSKTDATYARPDGLGGQPGYFTVRGVTWNLTDGVLTILGKGPMEEYASKNDVPWYTDRKSVVSVIIKDGVTVIGKNAFFDCINMTSAQIGKGVTKINNYAFRNCGSLTAVTIPSAVASLGKQAFSGCTGLTELTCEAITPPTCGDNVFEGVTNTIPVYVPAESVSAYKSADGWNYFENIQAKGAGTKEIYAAMVDGSKMVLYYDDQKSSRANVIEGWTPKYGTSGMEYKQEIAITLAELDASMQDARPTSTYLWFGRLENMTDIVHLDYLNTSEVMDMNFMFMVCNSLTSLDLHNFNTSSVVDMNGMFSSCSALTSLDVSGFNTSSVVGMNGMFSSCSALTSLDVSSFNTSSVVDMNNMFSGCSALTSLDVSGFNTSSVMDMGTMFYGCSSLTELDLSSFNTSSVTEMSIMFYDCSALKTIYCDDAWNPSSSDDMFGGCTALVGGKGTKYDDSKTDKTYARPDGLDSKPGYFTANTYTGEALIDGINYFLDGSDLTAQVLDLSGDKYVGDIVVPEKATYINDYTVTSINSEAFTNSPELLSVSLPKTVNWIEPGSFLRNPKLTAINVAPANTTYSSLDGVLFNTVQTELIAYPTGRAGAYVVPDGVESILDEAFTDNANLTAITLPASLIEIASLAFDECTGLTSITSKAVNAPAAGSDAFQKVSKSIPVYVPEKGLASYKAEYEWKDFTNFITIEDKAAADAVIVKIDAIGAVAYTTECKDRIDAARNAYDALTAEQKALVPAEKLAILTAAEKAYADLKAQAEADQAAADIVIGQINAIGTVTLSSEPAIVAARQAYDALTDAQKALVTNYAVLTAAEVKLEILKKQAESDAAAAAAVTDLINGIGTVTYTTDCKERIDAAREAYNALTDAQKALVTNLGTLTAAEKAYADLKAKAEADQAAADIVIGKINAIGVVSYSEASKALIDDARAAYDALTDAQKALIPAATYKVLTDAEQAYADLKAKTAADLAAANIVITKIDAIGSVTLSSEPAIVDARAAYNALTTDQKALVTNYATLVAAEKALADLKAKAAADQAAADNVIAQINAIGTVTLSSEPAIVAARAAYNALTADQKALVTNLSTLTAAEAKLDQLKKQAAADQAAADLVIGKINAIGTVSYSEASKALIDAARTAYDALTAAQQALVTNYGTLTAAEKAYADLKAKAEADQAAANTVIAQINAIGEVTLSSEPAIVAARSAYNALTADQKALVSNYNVLTAAEAKLEVLKKQAESDEAAAAAVSNLISGIGTVTYTTECKARIDAAREAYDALTADQKALVTNLATLTAAEKAYADLKAKAEADQAAANTVIAQINAIGEVTLSSEPAIVAARSAYNALTADQKALVSNYSVLTAAEAKLEVLKQQAEADQAAATAVIGKINAIGTVAYDEASKARIDDARHAYDALTAAQKALVTNLDVLLAAEQAYADLKAQAEVIAAAKQQLVDLVSEATALKAVAAMYAPSAVGEIEAIIASAQATINDPNATLEEINMKYNNLQYDFELEANKLLEEAKEQLKQSIRALYLPGDYPSWYASAIIPALDQVDAITWDFSKTVQENILLFQATGEALYNNAKKALEDLRAKDTRELVSSCTFTGFADAIQLDMTWNKSALNNLINTLNASVAAEPYRLDAEMSSLGKWDPVNKELIILDPYEAQKLTAGDYQFITAVKIDGEDAKQYRLPKATEEVLSVTVDAAVWSVDLSGIVIDANYSFTYVTSPMFTISKSEDVELVNEDPIKTQKIFHNGHFYILRGEHIYDLRGTRVK
ncbi:MAG: leucine-rich repeat protein [Paludibacteraceae bacterium]|nr:leucine-rich repeat protein [Paludibacteraceae bacterium]